MIISNNKFSIEINFERKTKTAEISFFSSSKALVPWIHYFNDKESTIEILEKSWGDEKPGKYDSGRRFERVLEKSLSSSIPEYCNYGKNTGTFTISDFKWIRSEICNTIEWLFSIGYEIVEFCPMDWQRFLATKRILSGYKTEYFALHSIVENKYFDGKISVKKGE